VTEWNIVTVVVVIVGLIGTVAAPLVKNTRAMTQLSGEIKNLIYRIEQNEKETDELKVKASSRHKQIFERLDEQGEKINNHEGRISALEHKEDKQ
jgi:cell division protein FtsL